jgi:hypothetical protein
MQLGHALDAARRRIAWPLHALRALAVGTGAGPLAVVASALLAALGGHAFDLICFKNPFYALDPVTPLEAAFYADSDMRTIHRSSSGSADHLAPGGRVVVVWFRRQS